MNINKSVLPTTSNHPISTNSTKLRASSQSFQHNPKFIRADATIPILGMRVFRVCILPTFCKGVEKDTLSKRPKASWNSSTWALRCLFPKCATWFQSIQYQLINDCIPWHDITWYLIWHVFTKKRLMESQLQPQWERWTCWIGQPWKNMLHHSRVGRILIWELHHGQIAESDGCFLLSDLNKRNTWACVYTKSCIPPNKQSCTLCSSGKTDCRNYTHIDTYVRLYIHI